MALVAGTYQFEKNENLVEYLVAIGLPEDKAKQFNVIATALTVKVDGKKITLSRPVQGDTVFTLGEEFDDKMVTGDVLKSTGTLDGNVLTIKSKTPSGQSGQRVYAFSESGLVVTLTTEVTPVVAKRYYKR